MHFQAGRKDRTKGTRDGCKWVVAGRRFNSTSGIYLTHGRALKTVHQDDLSDVGLHFRVLPRKGGVISALRFEKMASPSCTSVVQGQQMQELHAAACLWRTSGNGDQSLVIANPTLSVEPSAVRKHTLETGHMTCPRVDKIKRIILLDVPLPREVDITPHRCWTCVSSGEYQYFAVSVADLQDQLGVLHWTAPKLGQVFFTRRFLLYLLQSLYEKLNLRAVRRGVVELYTANFMGCPGITNSFRLLQGVPQANVFGGMLAKAFERFLEVPVLQLHLFFHPSYTAQ